MRRPRTSRRTLKRCVSAIVGFCLLDRIDPVKFITQAVRESMAARRRERT